MPTVLVSDAIGAERLTIEPARCHQGEPPWGWKALSALYEASLSACGFQTAPIIRPEIYQTDVARKVLGVAPGDWHLAVKPIEHLRPFHGIPNVFVCDWPFPELSAAPLGGSPFYDQTRLLRMADAVLCCTPFTMETLRRAGVERALTLPPAIPSPPETVAAARPGAGGRFLSVVDSGQLSRQLGATIEGFAQAAGQRAGLSLVIRVEGADAQQVADLRQRAVDVGAADTISVLDPGAGGAATAYTDADFFFCADAAPGLRLPLVQAMLAGVPAVATLTAGTASFLPQEAAIPVATEPRALDPEDEPIAGFLSLTAHAPTAATVREAVLAAAALGGEARSRMAARGRAIAERQFGLAAFRTGLGQLAGRMARPTA